MKIIGVGRRMEKKEKKRGHKLVVVLILLSIALLAGGGVLTYFTSPKYVAQTVIKEMGENATQILANRQETGLEENYSTTGTLKIDLQSDYFQGLSTTDSSYATIANLFRNLSNTQNNIAVVQDKENKRLFINYNSTLNGQNLFSTRYLVEDATEYYYIDGVTSTYVNNGNNNYFESLNSATTTNENLNYIIEKVTESVKDNIEDSYLSTTYEDNYKVVTITLTEDDLLKLGNNVLEDLKKDTKANQIMTGYNQNFADTKITKDQIKGIGTIQLHIYLNKISTQVERYELNMEDGTTLSYSIANGNKMIEITQNDSTTRFTITTTNDKTDITITDEENTTIGSVSISKTSTNYDIIANVTTDTMSMDFGYNTQMTNVKKGTSYDSSTTITLNISSQNTMLLNGTITLDTTTTSDTTIEEDTSTSVLASTLTGTESDLLSQKLITALTQLMS